MNWIKKNFNSLLVVILSSLLGVVLLEISLRIANFDDPWIKTREANILRDIEFTIDISNVYQHDSTSADYVRNKYGLRDTCDSTSDIDILTIGGSTTDQRWVPSSFTYQSILEERLTAQKIDFGCVSNAGVDGHSTWGHIFSFENWFPLIPELKPKFIVLYVGINDANFQRTNSPSSGFDNNNRAGIKELLRRLEIVRGLLPIYRLLRQSYENASAAYAGHTATLYDFSDYNVNVMNEKTPLLAKQNAEAFESRMLILLEKIMALNAIPICVTQPHRFILEKNGQFYGLPNILGEGFSGLDFDYSISQLNEVMFKLCGENTLDLYNYTFSDSHFYDGVHTTAQGSKVIGERLADFILTRFFLDK